ncbi:transcription termination factor NusA [Dehalococcoidia bacterium]|nr:transcription termination factor NusA [Dehalococcoidia bacterium]
MKSDFLVALTQLAAERNLPRDKVMSAIEAALVSAFKKDSVTEGRNISVRLDPGSGDIRVDIIKTVVDIVTDPLQEISMAEAQAKFRTNSAVGDTIATEEIPNSAGRIAAQTAKQVVLQRLREAEREIVLAEYEGREGEIITVTIQRIEPTKIIVDTGRTEAILPISQQVTSERYRQGSKVKVLLQSIDKESAKGPELIVSRTDELLLRRLFEQEVPEIFNGAVEIVGIARESGSRSKVAVRARQDGVDPVGSCVGLRGVRIQSIVNELQGEKIDILEWSKDPNRFIANALSPSQVHRVVINEEEGNAIAIVPDRHLSLAIGKEGQNARLAAKLAGWKVDIKSDLDVDLSKMPTATQPDVAAKPVVKEELGPPPSLDDKSLIKAVADFIDSASTVEIAGEHPLAPDASLPEVDEEAQLAALIALEENQGASLNQEEQSQSEDELTAEEELLLMEGEEEGEEEEEEEEEEESFGSDLSKVPEDIWSIHRAGTGASQSGGVIRFAEDIEDLRGGVTARRGKKSPSQANNRNRRSKPARRRR